LYHRAEVAPIHPIFFGGGQERGLRAGTENTAMIAGLGRAAELVVQNVGRDEKDLGLKRDRLESCLKVSFDWLMIVT